MASKSPKRQLSREEYRRVLLKERRRTMRTVRNTLICIAILAALWFVVLVARDKTLQHQQFDGSTQLPPVQGE